MRIGVRSSASSPTDFFSAPDGEDLDAIYRQIDLEDCIAEDVDDFVRIALSLGRDREAQQAMRQRILSRVHALYDNEETVRQYEDFFESVVRAR